MFWPIQRRQPFIIILDALELCLIRAIAVIIVSYINIDIPTHAAYAFYNFVFIAYATRKLK